MCQPQWKLVANLGDVNPIEYGGYLVYEDETGIYDPEVVIISPDEDGDDNDRWTVYRFSIERCTLTDGILSENPCHPKSAAWFANDLGGAASCVGMERDELIRQLCSSDLITRANGYRAIAEYHGPTNFDEYPITDYDRSEMEARYGAEALKDEG